MFKEIASLENAHDVFAFMMGTITYSDRIILQRGSGVLDWYDLMIDSDAWLSGLIDTRIGAVAGLKWEVIPGTSDEKDIKLAEFVEWAFDKIEKFYQDRKDLLAACRTGFAVSEVIYADKKWEGQTRLVPDRLLSRRPERFAFDKEYKLRLKVKGNTIKGIETDPLKFIVHQFDPRYEDPYGVALLRACYWPWWFKHNAMSWWLKAAERGAVVTPVGYYPEHYNKDEILIFEQALKRFMGDSYIAAKEGTNVTFPQIKIDPEFSGKLRDATNDEMVYRVLGGIQSTSGGEGGSLAKAAVHDRRFQERIESDSINLQDTLNDQLVKPIVLLNFPEPDNYPLFKIHFELPSDTAEIGKRLETAAKLAIPVSVADAAEMLMLPLAAEGEDVIKIQQAPSPFGGVGAPAGGPEPKPPDSPPPKEGDQAAETDNADQQASITDPEIAKALHSFQLRAERQAERLQKFMDGAASFGRFAADNIRRQINAFMKSGESYEELIAKAGSFQLDVSALSKTLYWTEIWGFLNGYADLRSSKKAIEAARGNVKPVRPRFQIVQLFTSQWQPVDPELAYELFRYRFPFERKIFDTLDDRAKRLAVTAAGMTQATIVANLHPTLLTALKTGVTLDEFKRQAGNIFLSDAHAENVFRTNMVSAYNSGHAEAMFDPAIRDAIVGFQFVAIVDARTTDICRSRAGQLYGKEELLNGNVPPLHYQCRSTIVEVFADEAPAKWADRPITMPQPGFGAWQPILNQPLIGPPVILPVTAPTGPITKPKKSGKSEFKELRTNKFGNTEVWPNDTPLIRNTPYDHARNSKGPRDPGTKVFPKEPFKPAGQAPVFPTVADSEVPPGITPAGRAALPEFNQQMQKDLQEGLVRTFDTGLEWAQSYSVQDGSPYHLGLVRGNKHSVHITRPGQNSVMWHTHPFGDVKGDSRIIGGCFSGADLDNCARTSYYAGTVLPGNTQIEMAIDNKYVYILRRDPQFVEPVAAELMDKIDKFTVSGSFKDEAVWEKYHVFLQETIAEYPGLTYTRLLRSDLGL
jgi:SPP1 gp7 family putative phage head morphogenesis protein